MGFYTPPSITVTRQDVQTSIVLTGGEVIPALIGTSFGKTATITGYQAMMGASDVYTFPNLAPNGPVANVVNVRSALQAGIQYQSGTDYTFNAGTQQITFNDVALTAPYLLSLIDVIAASSNLSNSTVYYYVVTALRNQNLTGPVVGETVASTQLSAMPVTATSQILLTWRPVLGASGYKIYRSTVSGNFTGNALLATISSGYTTSYQDNNSSTVSGSPPGVLVFAQETAATPTPSTIANNQTLSWTVDSTPFVTTLTGTRPSITGTGAVYPVTINTGINDTLVLKVTDATGAYTTTVVFAAGSTALASIVTQITSAPFINGTAVASGGGQLTVETSHFGSICKIQVVGGNAMATLGLTASTASGTGNLPDFSDVTTANVAAAINTVMSTVATATVAANGNLVITNNLGGSAHSLTAHSDAVTLLGFTGSTVTGNNATAGTAFRRPAWNGDSFFVDYTFTSFNNFNPTRYTNLTRLLSDVGVGSNLAIAGTLCMGTAGRGNGASQVVVVSIPDDTLFSHQTALDLLLKRTDVTLVVPCTVVAGIQNAALQHCLQASNTTYRRERRTYLGTPKGTVTGDSSTSGSAVFQALALANERATLLHPWPFVNVQQSNLAIVETEMDGWAGAAAVSGMIASLSDRATSPTCQQVQGITRLGVVLDPTEENVLASAGICVLTLEDGNIIVRDGITTDMTDQSKSRIQIGLVDDFLKQTFRTQFKSFRGRKLLPNLLKLVIRRTLRILALFKKLELIADFSASSVSAVQDPNVLTTVDAAFSYRPVFDVKNISFSYFLDLTTGSIA